MGESHNMKKQKKKKLLLAEAGKPDRHGICFLSRIPPHMDHVKVGQILSQYGEIQRIYLASEDPAARVQKLALELAASKRECDFYLSKVDMSHALSSKKERRKKKQKIQQESETNSEQPINQQKINRHFSQTKPVAHTTAQSKLGLSKDILARVFGCSL